MQDHSDSESNCSSENAVTSLEKVPKRTLDLAALTEPFELNDTKFEVKTQNYSDNKLLNGITFDLCDGGGQVKFQQHMRLIDSTSILVYNGVSLLDYSVTSKNFKEVRKVPNLLLVSHSQEMYTGRMYVGSLSKVGESLKIEVIDFLSRKVVYKQFNTQLAETSILHFFVCFSHKSFYLIIHQMGQETFVEVKTISGQKLEQAFLLSGPVQHCHYNCDIDAFLFSRDKSIYMLKQIGGDKSCKFDQKLIIGCQQKILMCRSSDNMVGMVTSNEISVYNMESGTTQAYEISGLVEEYTSLSVKVSAMEFKNSVLLVSFQQISVVWCLSLHNYQKRVKEIPFKSVNFKSFTRILIDPIASTALLVSCHAESQIADNTQELSLGQPNKTVLASLRHSYSKASLIHLNILNTIYAMEYLPWETYEYINIMADPCSNGYFFHTKCKVVTPNWSHGIDEALSSSLHPNCLSMAIGFRDCFKIYAILSDGLSYTNVGGNLRECVCMSYSNSGHHLAISSSNNIYIYDSYSNQKLHVVPPQQNSSIRELKYQNDNLIVKPRNGTCFVYISANSYCRGVAFFPKSFANGQKPVAFDIVEYDMQFDVFICGCTNQLRFFSNGGTTDMATIEVDYTVTSMLICKELKTMFMGTADGEIVSFPWPNNPVKLRQRQPKKKVHDSPIVHIRIRSDLKEIVATSTNGGLYIGKLRIVNQMHEIMPQDVCKSNFEKISLIRLLKQQKIMLHSTSLETDFEAQIKQLEQQINNDCFVHPIQEQKFSLVGATRLQKCRETLITGNQRLIQTLQGQHTLTRRDIRAIKEIIQASRSQKEERRDRLVQSFNKVHQGMSKRHRELQIQYCRVKEDNRVDWETAHSKFDFQDMGVQEHSKHVVGSMDVHVGDQGTKINQSVVEWAAQTEEIEADHKQLGRQALSRYDQQLRLLDQAGVDLMIQNSKLSRQISMIGLKVKDLKEPLTDLKVQVSKYDPQLINQLYQKQELVQKTSASKMKEKEFAYMKTMKETLVINKGIQFHTDVHKQLIVDIDRLEGYSQELDHQQEKVQQDILEQKNESIRYAKLQLRFKSSMEVLKKRRKEFAEKTLNVGVLLRRQYQGLAISLKQNGVQRMVNDSLLPRVNTQVCDDNTTMPSTANKPKRLQTQLLKTAKAFYAYQRVGNTISNMRKIFNNHLVKAYDQNQDLLECLNSLSLQRSTLKQGINKTLETFDSVQRSGQSRPFKLAKMTPFQTYQQSKKKTQQCRRTKQTRQND